MTSQHLGVNNNKSFYRTTSRAATNSAPPLPSSSVPSSTSSGHNHQPWSLSPRRYEEKPSPAAGTDYRSSVYARRQQQKTTGGSSCVGGRFAKPILQTRSSFEQLHAGVSYKVFNTLLHCVRVMNID